TCTDRGGTLSRGAAKPPSVRAIWMDASANGAPDSLTAVPASVPPARPCECKFATDAGRQSTAVMASARISLSGRDFITGRS
ncbi:MAG: hypothetical protein M3R07_02820, partial [Gemmatimonadota bacterium]|nr:hypothetical protein [Gemmatimonadota bacterium]